MDELEGWAPRVLVLGPVAIVGDDGVAVDVTGHAGRLLVELVGRGPLVSRDRLLEVLWPSEALKSADAALRVHLSRLRKLLSGSGARVERRAEGHELVGAATDLARFDQLLGQARSGRADATDLADLNRASALVDSERALPLCEADPGHRFAAPVRAGYCLVGGTFAWQALRLADAEIALGWAEATGDELAIYTARSAVALGAGVVRRPRPRRGHGARAPRLPPVTGRVPDHVDHAVAVRRRPAHRPGGVRRGP